MKSNNTHITVENIGKFYKYEYDCLYLTWFFVVGNVSLSLKYNCQENHFELNIKDCKNIIITHNKSKAYGNVKFRIKNNGNCTLMLLYHKIKYHTRTMKL